MKSLNTNSNQSNSYSSDDALRQLVDKLVLQSLTDDKSSDNNQISLTMLQQLVERQNWTEQVQLKILGQIEELYKEQNTETIPLNAVIPGLAKKHQIDEKNILMAAYPNLNSDDYDMDLVDPIDEMYFASANIPRGISEYEQNANSQLNKDLKEFEDFNASVHANVIRERARIAERAKMRTYNPNALTMSSYYSEADLKQTLRAKRLDKELRGFCINLLTSDKMLPPGHEIFQKFGGMMIEKVSETEYRYFIGTFSSKKGAEQYIEQILNHQIENTEVVYYKKGNRKSELWQFFFARLD